MHHTLLAPHQPALSSHQSAQDHPAMHHTQVEPRQAALSSDLFQQALLHPALPLPPSEQLPRAMHHTQLVMLRSHLLDPDQQPR